MPQGSKEIGRLQGIMQEEPTEDFHGAGLKRKYAGLPIYQDPSANAIYLPTSEGFLMFRADPDPFGHTYRVADTVYYHPGLSFSMTPENAPLYALTKEKKLQIKESTEWLTAGTFTKIELTEENFDDLFLDDGWPTGKSIAEYLREKNAGAWRVRVGDAAGSAAGETVCYYLIQLPDGTLYLTYGMYDYEGEADPHSDDSEIRWLFLLERVEEANETAEGVSVYSGPNQIQASLCDSVADIASLREQVEYLTIAPYETEGVPFRVFADGTEVYGWYSIYDAETEETLDFLHPSGLAPQTYILQNAQYGHSYVVTLLADANGDDAGDLIAFGVTVPRAVDMPGALDAAVSDAIMAHNQGKYREGEFRCESHTILEVEESRNTVTAYLVALYQEYARMNGEISAVSGGHIPTAITFSIEDGAYVLQEYWEPRDGSYYAKDLAKKFPSGLDYGSQSLYETHKADCDAKADAYFASAPETEWREASLDLDMDGDGEADTAFLSCPATPMPENPYARLMIKLGTGTLLETTINGEWMGPQLYAGDVNGDGRDELILCMEVFGTNYGASGVFAYGVEGGNLTALPDPEAAIPAAVDRFVGQSDFERGYGDCLGGHVIQAGEQDCLRLRLQKGYAPGYGNTTAWYVDMRLENGAWAIQRVQTGEAYGEDKIIG